MWALHMNGRHLCTFHPKGVLKNKMLYRFYLYFASLQLCGSSGFMQTLVEYGDLHYHNQCRTMDLLSAVDVRLPLWPKN